MEQEQRIYNIIRENRELLNLREQDLRIIEIGLMYSYSINKSLDLMLGLEEIVPLKRLGSDD